LEKAYTKSVSKFRFREFINGEPSIKNMNSISMLCRYNKAESDFRSLVEYNNYLEEVEDISK